MSGDRGVNRIRFGTITKPHGRRGEVRVHSFFDPEDRITVVYLADRPDETPRRVESLRRHSDVLLMKLEGVDSRAQAETLRNAAIEVDRCMMPALEPGSFYLEDLLECRVVSVEGEDLGRVKGLLEGGYNQVLRVRRDEGEWLLPAAREVIVDVRLDEGVLVVDPPEGLVELP